jgi:hypothetical protein
MDHQFPTVRAQHHKFEEVPGPVWTDDEIARRVVGDLGPGDSVVIGMLDVHVGHMVPACRPMDLHTE